MQSLLSSGKHDHRDCFFTISAGDGGTEANDWARCCCACTSTTSSRWAGRSRSSRRATARRSGIDVGDAARQGPFAFGYLNCERGTHRLARVSPFNSQGKRQTSFATVDITPEFEENDGRDPGEGPGDPGVRAVERAGRAEREQGRERGAARAQADGDHGRVEHAPEMPVRTAAGAVDPAGEARAEGSRRSGRRRSPRPRAGRSSTAGGARRSGQLRAVRQPREGPPDELRGESDGGAERGPARVRGRGAEAAAEEAG
jgi:hypothetical protein